MAGDWIKMRSDLFTHPKVVRITSALKADRLRTVGGLMSVWCLFDTHSTDGHLEGYDLDTVDEMLGWPGFSSAMKMVGWLAQDSEGLVLPEFDTHNGQSAKRRAQDSDRKRAERLSASEADKNGTREEKRREEKKEATLVVKKGESGEKQHPPASQSDRTRASRLPLDWALPLKWGDWALGERPDWNHEKVRSVAEQFRDHWLSKGGQDARKVDWEATWRTWVRREQSLSGATNYKTGGPVLNKQEALEARNREIAMRLTAEMNGSGT